MHRVMKRPRIYGNEARFRAAVARYIDSAEELLDQAVGVRNRIAAAPENRENPVRVALVVESTWVKDVRRWFSAAGPAMWKYLQEQHDVLPVIANGLPPDTGKPRHRIGLDNGEPWLRAALEELKAMQAALGVRRGLVAATPAPARFEELHASGLLAEKVIADYAKEMLAPRISKQLRDAIGSAKELTEATLRAALDQLEESYRPQDDLPALMRTWRRAIGKQAPPDPEGQETLDKAQAALANVVTFLAEWRNTYGRGHGLPEYPLGLAKRHARLAADAAETCVRFIVTTMDDLERLPP